MSFFGRKRDKVTAFAISDGTSGHAVSKMADQIRVRWSGLRRIAIILCRPVVPMSVRNLSYMLWTVEKAECRADHTVEERALGTYTGQDADTHQHGEQMLRQADCWSGTRDRPIRLTLFHASQEE
jgi:hypothetical protein